MKNKFGKDFIFNRKTKLDFKPRIMAKILGLDLGTNSFEWADLVETVSRTLYINNEPPQYY